MSKAYRTMQLMKRTRYDLVLDIQAMDCGPVPKIWSKRKSELIGILMKLEEVVLE